MLQHSRLNGRHKTEKVGHKIKCVSKQKMGLLVITSATVDRVSKFFY